MSRVQDCTWKSIWPYLLKESVINAREVAVASNTRVMGKAATSIILAKTCWDAFLSSYFGGNCPTT